MSKILIINGHQPYPFAKGQFNSSLTQIAKETALLEGHEVRTTSVAEEYDVDAEVANHVWADLIIMQFPANWMGVPWSFKKYMDEVYTAGMDGRLCDGDGRNSSEPKSNYGMGGTLNGTRYMLSVSFNAPAEAFNDEKEPFFAGATVDDLLKPVHWNMKFFGAEPMKTFSAHDVMKAPEVEKDLERFRDHITSVLNQFREAEVAA